MMKIRLPSVLLLAVLSISLQSCGTSRAVGQLEGTWRMMRPNGGERLETWSKTSEGEWTGRGLRVTGADTVLLEILTLRTLKGRWQYIAEVPDQNEGEPVVFDCTDHKRNEIVFTNSRHDFPQRIRYRLIPTAAGNVADSMIVTLGTLDTDQVILRFTRRH